MGRLSRVVFATCLIMGMEFLDSKTAQAQNQYNYYPGYQLNRFFYYPYQYFAHNYWPAMGPRWPEGQNMPYQPPPAYQAYPAFREPNWRYEMWQPQKYYRGFHFWLDQF
ncbi:MAG: hypothetical protein L0Y72_21370 [Gemmataceae bacterium]|nr:hypothetical protein [Gemmataceae bacterium]MCI0741594.1 hypothetical protein [Gemmataceae bacterium]